MLFFFLIYLAISIGVTCKVGSLLHKHGTVFLLHRLPGLESLARSINNLLLVGFYLVNIGYILIVMNLRSQNVDPFTVVSTHLGIVFFSLGPVHFLLLRVLVVWQPKILQLNVGDK